MALVGYDPNKKASAQRPPRAGRATFRLLEQAITSSKARPGEAQPAGRLYLVPLAGDGLPEMLLVEKPETILGRQKSADLRVRDGKASRQHCKIVLGAEGAMLIDMGSSNGTFVNGARVEQYRLSDGDLIRLGDTVLRARYIDFEGPSDSDAYWFATRDRGTALHNRAYLLEALRREVARASRHEYPLTLLVTTIDLSGVAGETRRRLLDAEMRALGAEVQQENEDALVCRYSSTAMVVVIPMLRSAEAIAASETALSNRESSAVEEAGGNLSLFTGAADFPDGAASFEQLMHHAEIALYRAVAGQSVEPEIYRE